MKPIERLVLQGLVHDPQYSEKVLPFIVPEYFQSQEEAAVFRCVQSYIEQYKNPPSREAIELALDEDRRISESQLHQIMTEIVPDVFDVYNQNTQWLIDSTEKFCQDRALYNAILHSLKIVDGEDKNLTKDSIPDVIQTALSISFEPGVGHDFIDDADARFDSYQTTESKLSFRIPSLDQRTMGGYERKTLNVVMAPTGVGKSIFLCNIAANAILDGNNVLYVTLEMAENKIIQRIEQNLLDLTVQEIIALKKETYIQRIRKYSSSGYGKLKVKQYPTSSAHAGHFRALLADMKSKQNFVPDIIIVDYINICASSRFKPSNNANSYTIVKAIAEELRGLGVETNAAVWSATQPTREGMKSSDMELQDTSESIGLPQTTDFMFAIITNDDLERMNQVMVKQLKNRYDGIDLKNKRFILGLNKEKMRFFEVDAAEQTLINESSDEEESPPFVAQNSRRKFGR